MCDLKYVVFIYLGRACWSLGNAYTALEDHERALRFAEEHLLISKEVCLMWC